MKDIINLEKQLNRITHGFKNASLTSSTTQNTPIEKCHLEKLQKETFNALEGFKNAIIAYLSD